MKRSQTARTSPGVSGPFQWRGVGKWRSRVAGNSRRSSVVHKTGRSATISTRSMRGSVVFIPPFYPPPPFPKTTPYTSEPAVRTLQCRQFAGSPAVPSPGSGLDHRQDAGPDRLGQIGPGGPEIANPMGSGANGMEGRQTAYQPRQRNENGRSVQPIRPADRPRGRPTTVDAE
jgi:hypothetical protein